MAPLPFVAGEVLTAARLNALILGATTWTPTITGLTAGYTVATARYSIGGGVLAGVLKLNITGAITITGDLIFSLPAPINSAGAWMPFGQATLHDVSASGRYGGTILRHSSDSFAAIRFNGTSGATTSITPTVPFTWAAGDEILASFSVPL